MSAASAKIGREIREQLSRTLADVMLLANSNLIGATPIDTGNAGNNWILSVGSPYASTDGSRESPSDAAQREGIDRMATYDVGRDGPIYLRNNVLYVQFLDAGSSPQAEAGFVAASFAAATQAAPRGRKTAVRKMLRGMARAAYIKGI